MRARPLSRPGRGGAVTASVLITAITLALAGGQNTLQAQLIEGTSGVSFSGQATVVDLTDIHNFTSPIVLCDTGPLPSSGGFLQASLSETSVANGALTFTMARATTRGDDSLSVSDSSVNNFFIEVMASSGATFTMRANFMSTEATASCDSTGHASVGANAVFEGLVINGVAIKVAARAINQVVNVPGGQVIVNERISSVNGGNAHIQVAALHIMITGCMQGYICFSEADISCGTTSPPPPTECDKLTGGGWIVGTPSGEKGTFGVSGGIRRGEFWGHLNYIDHGNGMHVHSTAVTGYAVDPNDSTCRIIDYDVDIDGSSGTARVRACDKGEPGRDDIFQIQVSNGYFAGGDLGGDQPGGGNIQLHKCPPGWQ